jgi:hypothetical protein
MKWYHVLGYIPAAIAAWGFPRQPNLGQTQQPMGLGIEDDVDVTIQHRFNGLTTYAGVPYVNCFANSKTDEDKYDIAIMGAPFDTVSIFMLLKHIHEGGWLTERVSRRSLADLERALDLQASGWAVNEERCRGTMSTRVSLRA